MTEKRTFFEQVANRVFANPTVAQMWAKRTAEKTANFVDLSSGIDLAADAAVQLAVDGATAVDIHLTEIDGDDGVWLSPRAVKTA